MGKFAWVHGNIPTGIHELESSQLIPLEMSSPKFDLTSTVYNTVFNLHFETIQVAHLDGTVHLDMCQGKAHS